MLIVACVLMEILSIARAERAFEVTPICRVNEKRKWHGKGDCISQKDTFVMQLHVLFQ